MTTPRKQGRREIGWAALGAATALVVLSFAERVASAPAACAQTLPSGLVTLCPGDPLRPDDLNKNFAQILAWTTAKLGPVGQPATFGAGTCWRFPKSVNVAAGASFDINISQTACAGGYHPIFDGCDAPGADLTHVGINATSGAWCSGVNASGSTQSYTLTVDCCQVTY
jgi:hypothetical protein